LSAEARVFVLEVGELFANRCEGLLELFEGVARRDVLGTVPSEGFDIMLRRFGDECGTSCSPFSLELHSIA